MISKDSPSAVENEHGKCDNSSLGRWPASVPQRKAQRSSRHPRVETPVLTLLAAVLYYQSPSRQLRINLESHPPSSESDSTLLATVVSIGVIQCIHCGVQTLLPGSSIQCPTARPMEHTSGYARCDTRSEALRGPFLLFVTTIWRRRGWRRQCSPFGDVLPGGVWNRFHRTPGGHFQVS